MTDPHTEIEMLTALIDRAQRAREASEAELAEAELRVKDLDSRVHVLREEEAAFRAALARRSPDAAKEAAETMVIGDQDAINWANLPRTVAVDRAIEELNEATPTVSPAEIEALLRLRGRADSRDEIGGATAHLNRTKRIHSVGRGKWVHGPAPEKAPGDTVPAVPPGSAPTERQGGDGHAAGPELLPDHDPAFGGRDDRDHHRLAGDAVAIQF